MPKEFRAPHFLSNTFSAWIWWVFVRIWMVVRRMNLWTLSYIFEHSRHRQVLDFYLLILVINPRHLGVVCNAPTFCGVASESLYYPIFSSGFHWDWSSWSLSKWWVERDSKPLWSPQQWGCRHTLMVWPNPGLNHVLLYSCSCSSLVLIQSTCYEVAGAFLLMEYA